MVLSSQHFNTANTEGAQQIMILLLTGKGFVGFIPNDQKQFIENLKKVVSNHRAQQQHQQQAAQQAAAAANAGKLQSFFFIRTLQKRHPIFGCII